MWGSCSSPAMEHHQQSQGGEPNSLSPSISWWGKFVFLYIYFLFSYNNGISLWDFIFIFVSSMTMNGKQVAEFLVKRCLSKGVFLASLLLRMLSFRLGTLLLCGYSCFDWRWPFILKFSDISLEKREKILYKWSRYRGLVPLRLVFMILKIFCFFTLFSKVMLLTHHAISCLFYFSE